MSRLVIPPSLAPTARFHRRCKPHCNRSWHFRTSRQRRLPQRETAWALRAGRVAHGGTGGAAEELATRVVRGRSVWCRVVKTTTVKCDPGVGTAVSVKALAGEGKDEH